MSECGSAATRYQPYIPWDYEGKSQVCERMKPHIAICFAVGAVLFSSCAYQPLQQRSAAPPNPGKLAARYALTMVGTPYRYGGKTPKGFDCSGLVHYSYARAGVKVPRTTDQQRKRSRRVSWKAMRPGDLLFFNQLGKRSSHVGLYIGNHRFVHAPSSGKSVHVSVLTSRYWRRHFAEARRFDVSL